MLFAQMPVVSSSQLTVPEGGYASLTVRLDSAPAGTAVVNVSRFSGDADLVGSTVVLFELNVGSYKLALYDSEAPLTVANLLNYIGKGSNGGYDLTVIHRSVPGFVLQGGGYELVGNELQHIPTDPAVVNEYALSSLRSTVAMAKVGSNPDSATSEWFINLADNSANLDFQNGGFTVFGEVIDDGMFLIDAIAALPRANLGGAFTSLPYVTQDNVNYYIVVNRVTVTASTRLSFTSENWATPQTVTFRAIPDVDLADDGAVFRCQAPAGHTDISLTENDDDSFQILVSPDTPTIPEAGTGALGVRLAQAPAGSVTVTVTHSGGDADLAITAGTSLTFTPSDWQTEKPVTLAAADDADVAAGVARIRLTAAGAATVDVNVAEADNDCLAIVPDAAGLTIAEGGSAELRIHLSGPPTDAVQVQANVAGDDGSFSVPTPAALTFTPTNWDRDQVLTVSAAEDDSDDVNGADTLTLSFGATDDPTDGPVEIDLEETDDDVPVTVSAVGPGDVNPAGQVYADTNGAPLKVQGLPHNGAVFFEWTVTGGIAIPAPRTATATVEPVTPGTMTAHFSADTDADGLPDAWEDEQIHASPDDSIVDLADLVPDADLDRDGFTNYDELLTGTSPLHYVIPLETNWNLLGFAYAPRDPRPSIVFCDPYGGPVTIGPAWEWDTDAHTSSYSRVTELVPGCGYWVHALAATDVEIAPADAAPSNSIPLAEGWNLIAIPFRPDNNSVTDVFGNAIHGSVWEYHAGGYEEVTHVVPLRGYWVYAPGATTVTLTPRGPLR